MEVRVTIDNLPGKEYERTFTVYLHGLTGTPFRVTRQRVQPSGIRYDQILWDGARGDVLPEETYEIDTVLEDHWNPGRFIRRRYTHRNTLRFVIEEARWQWKARRMLDGRSPPTGKEIMKAYPAGPPAPTDTTAWNDIVTWCLTGKRILA